MSVWTFLISLGLTLALEVPFAFLWGLRRRDLILCVLVNLLTNPAVVLLYYLLSAVTVWPRFAIQLPLEALAIAVEAICYDKCGQRIRRPGWLSVCANTVSYTAGLLLAAMI